ncbi:TniQ family protein [Deinococcus budaensis]|uniref:TniQ family protein n=1 Tax=Deinococcus budaensis TaxID=1665626 RepID=UPI0035F26097
MSLAAGCQLASNLSAAIVHPVSSVRHGSNPPNPALRPPHRHPRLIPRTPDRCRGIGLPVTLARVTDVSRRLPVHPPPRPGEWLGSWLLRLAQAHVLPLGRLLADLCWPADSGHRKS